MSLLECQQTFRKIPDVIRGPSELWQFQRAMSSTVFHEMESYKVNDLISWYKYNRISKPNLKIQLKQRNC